MTGRLVVLSLLLLAVSIGAQAQTISGHVYDDRDADGIREAGEPGIEGVQVVLYGTTAIGGAVNQTVFTGADGSYSFAPGDGFYLVMPVDPAGWRLGPARRDGIAPGTPGYAEPLGQARFAKLDQGIANLESGQYRYSALGDSIGVNWNSCSFAQSYEYSNLIAERLRRVAPAATVTLDESAVKGEHTDDLLVDDGAADRNNVFATIADQPELITISIIGNDLLDVDVGSPTQAQVNTAVSEILDARQNLQETLSVMLSEIPGADVALNTLYDNEAQGCSSTPFHREWIPIIGRMLRDLAWGQARRISINEIFPEFAHEDQLSGCTGFTDKICNGLFDGIHPNDAGYAIVLEKVWEAIGGTALGPVQDGPDPGGLKLNPVERHTLADVDFGYLNRVRRLSPTTWQTLGGAAAQDPENALDGQDADAAAGIELVADGDEFRVAGFPGWYDEIQVVRVVAGLRYRTAGTFGADGYRMEASVDGQFRPPPAHDFSTTSWNFYTPIVGGGGPAEPPGEDPLYADSRLLVVPNVPVFRDASATLTKNPVLPGGAAEYEWPAVTRGELATTEVRIAATPHTVGCGGDCPEILLDHVWLDLYGWEKPRPAEVQSLKIGKLPDGTLELSFDAVPGAARYNLYDGRLATVRAGGYDHGAGAPAGPLCDATVESIGGGRLKIVLPPGQQFSGDSDYLVTAHVDDVESPAGHRSDATEIDRSQSICD